RSQRPAGCEVRRRQRPGGGRLVARGRRGASPVRAVRREPREARAPRTRFGSADGTVAPPSTENVGLKATPGPCAGLARRAIRSGGGPPRQVSLRYGLRRLAVVEAAPGGLPIVAYTLYD